MAAQRKAARRRTGPTRARRRLRLEPIHVLAALAAIAPLAIAQPFFDQVAMPRLVVTLALTGVTLGVIALMPIGVSKAAFRHPAAIAAAAFVAIEALATALGVDPIGSLLGEFQRYQGLLPRIVYVVLGLSAAIAARRAKDARLLLWGLVTGGTLAACYAALDALGLDWLDWETRAPDRLGGLFGQPNVLAIELVVAGAAAGGLAASSTGWRRDLAAGGLGLMAAALVLTYSRGGWVGAAVAAGVFLALRAPLTRTGFARLGAVAVVAVTVLAVVPQGRSVLDSAVARGQSTIDVRAQSTRLGLWENAIEMAADRPLLGAGPDAFSVLFPEYRDPDQPGIERRNVRPESSHSIWLDQLVGSGVLGLAAFVTLIAIVLRAGALGALREADPARRAVVAALTAGLAGYLGATTFAFAEAMTGWLPWLVGGAVVGLTSMQAAAGRVAPRRALGAGVRTAFAVASIALFFEAVTLGIADRAAGGSLRADSADEAVRAARHASDLVPISPAYLLNLARIEEARGDHAGTEAAALLFHRHNERFAPTGYSLLAEASALFVLDPAANASEVRRLVEEARSLDPHNADLAGAAGSLLDALDGG